MPQRAIRKQTAAGFTLIELMIVVSIVGILAVTAMPSFQGYVMRSRANDGRMLVEVMRLRQEAYRSEFGTYVTAATAPGALNGVNYVPWVGNAQWTALGFAPPSGRTRFSFTATSGPPVVGGAPMGMAGTDFWYFVTADADFDGDGDLLNFTGFSEADFIFCNQVKGWE